jgi:hypothetical protein
VDSALEDIELAVEASEVLLATFAANLCVFSGEDSSLAFVATV